MDSPQSDSVPNRSDTHRILFSRLLPTVLLLLILVVSISFRLIDIRRGLWLDELHTSWTVADGAAEVGWRARAGNQTPVYFYLVNSVVGFFGHSEFTLRFISVISGLGISLLMYFALRILSGSQWAGLLGALLVALDPYFVEYSQEARPYALLQLLGLAQVCFFLIRFGETQMDEDDRAKPGLVIRSSFILSIVCCFYIHFTSIVLTASLLLIIVLWNFVCGNRWNKRRLAVLIDFGAALILCLPLTGSVVDVSARRTNWELFVNDDHWTPALWFQFWSYVLPGLIGFMIWSFVDRKKHSTQKLGMITASLAAFLLPILVSWISYKAGIAALYHQRYFMIGWPCGVLFACFACGMLIRNRDSRVWISGCVIGLVIITVSLFLNTLIWHCLKSGKMPFESSWSRAIGRLNQQVRTNDLVFLFPNLIEDRLLLRGKASDGDPRLIDPKLIEYAEFPVRGIYRLSEGTCSPRSTLSRPRFDLEDKSELAVGTRVFLLIRGNDPIVSDILNEFAEFGLRNDIFLRGIRSERFEMRGVPDHALSLFEFEVYDGQAHDNGD